MQLLLREWAPSKREDFVFRLMRDVHSLEDGELVEGYPRYIATEYSDNETQDYNLRTLMGIFLRLPKSARIEILDGIRRLLR